MTSFRTQNGQIPTDPHTTLVLTLAVICAAGQLTTEQAQALVAAGGEPHAGPVAGSTWRPGLSTFPLGHAATRPRTKE